MIMFKMMFIYFRFTFIFNIMSMSSTNVKTFLINFKFILIFLKYNFIYVGTLSLIVVHFRQNNAITYRGTIIVFLNVF